MSQPQVPNDLILTSFPFDFNEQDQEEQSSSSSGIFKGFVSRFFTEKPPEQLNPSASSSTDASSPLNNVSPSSTNESEVGDIKQTRKISTKITNLLKSESDRKLIDYNGSVFRRYWMPDSAVQECYECHERFTTFRRRHHCRFCGQIFCGKCCAKQMCGADLGYNGVLRLCNYCFESVAMQCQALGSSGVSSVQGSPKPSRKVSQNTTSSYNSRLAPVEPSESVIHTDPSVADLLSTPEKPTVGVDDGDIIQHDSFKSAYEPCSDDNEPDWVKNLHNKSTDGAKVFAPTSIAPPTNDRSSSQSPTQFQMRTGFSDFISNNKLTTNAQLFEAQTNAFLDYLFECEQVDKNIWRPLLVPLAQEIVNTVNVDTVNRPKLINILDYVHIKKLCVDGVPSVEKVNGVVFSKALHHNSMARYGENASIMLLLGNITYERVVEKMSSLEPIMQQEHEFIKNQVHRIASRKVNLVFVEQDVSTMALDSFLAFQIGMCNRVKLSVLNRLSRCSGADIITSLDTQFLQPRIGFCPRYYERTVKLANGQDKQLMVLDECDSSLGVSIVIRASSHRELVSVKRILQLLLQMYYSNKCELAYLQVFNTNGPLTMSTCAVCQENQNDDLDGPADTEFAKGLREAQLTNSPLIRIVPPYLETTEGKKCFLLEYFKKPPFHFYDHDALVDLKTVENDVETKTKQLQSITEAAKLALNKQHINSKLRNKHLTDSHVPLEEFKVRSVFLARRCLEAKKEIDKKSNNEAEDYSKEAFKALEKPASRNIDVLNPYRHQRKSFLYCAEGAARRWLNSGSFCSGPSVLVWRFYASGEDMTIRTFLTRFCFNPEYKCQDCDKPMTEHFRKIIHHNTYIEISTQVISPKLPQAMAEMCPLEDLSELDKDVLIAWKHCSKCGARSKCCIPNDWMLNMSFAKFIDYLSNGVHWISDLKDEEGHICQHCAFHEHVHLFAARNMVTSFKVTLVKPLHVLFAPMLCHLRSRLIGARSLVTECNELKRLSNETFQEMGQSCDSPSEVNHLSVLKDYVDQIFECFDEDGSIETSSEVSSDNPVYLKSDDCLTKVRHFLNAVIDEWNDRRAQPNLELDPLAKLKNLCAKFNIVVVNATQKDDLSRLDTNSLLNTTSSSAVKLNETKSALMNPFNKLYHLELPIHKCTVPIIVKDIIDGKGQATPDIGSVIAFALSSKDYQDKRRQLLTKTQTEWPRNRSSNSMSSTWTSMVNTAAVSYSQPGLQALNPPLTSTPISPVIEPAVNEDPQSAAIELDFADTKAHYYVKVFFAESFHSLRDTIFPAGEAEFLRSISNSEIWTPQGGKSGASFFRSKDERFVFKQMSRLEMESFKSCASKYVEYINKAFAEKRLTALCKIYGVFRVGYNSKVCSSQLKMDLLVMEYLFYNKKVKQMWDLKGSLRNRYASTKTDAPVLLDENLVQDLWDNQLYVHHHSKVALKQAIAHDSKFLSAQHIMDYSLLAGICQDTNQVVVGIVDYMRTYTLDKKVESLVKTVIPGTHLPTVISPENYSKRFLEAIDCYFAMAPDQWTCLDSAASQS